MADPRSTPRARVSWDEYFMNIAREVSSSSTCDRKFVGAVIVRDKCILATGYNGSIRGLPHCDEDGHLMEEGHCVRTVHAEANAIVQAARNGVRIDGSTIYVTASPCWGCFRLIANSGIARVVFGEFYRDPKIFDVAQRLGIELVDMSGKSAGSRAGVSPEGDTSVTWPAFPSPSSRGAVGRSRSEPRVGGGRSRPRLQDAGHHVVRFELDGYLAESIRSGGFDVVFPAVHGAVGEDGSLQGLLEVLDLPYVGAGVLASARAMDKGVARIVFAAAQLPVAKGLVAVRGGEGAGEVARRALREVSARLVVKPSTSGSALGVARFDEGAGEAEVARGIEAAWELSPGAIVEHFARGREVTCGVLDLGAPAALPPTEISSPRDAFYTYEARYTPGRSVHTCPAPLGPELTARVQALAVAAHVALGCRDLSRVDFVVGDSRRRDAADRRRDPDHAARGEYAPGLHRDEPVPRSCRRLRHPDARSRRPARAPCARTWHLPRRSGAALPR